MYNPQSNSTFSPVHNSPSQSANPSSKLPARPMRFRVQGHVTISTPWGNISGKIKDVSLEGCGINATNFPDMKPGQEVNVRIEGLPQHRGEIRWISMNSIGIKFLQPLREQELEDWRQHG